MNPYTVLAVVLQACLFLATLWAFLQDWKEHRELPVSIGFAVLLILIGLTIFCVFNI